jgi:hypothetical protein
LTSRSTLDSSFIGTEAGAPVYRKHALDFGVWPGNHVYANQLTNSSRCCGSGIGGGFNSANVPPHKDRYVTGANVLFTEQLDIRSLNHCIRGFYSADEPFGLYHSECFKGHLRHPHFSILEIKATNRFLAANVSPCERRIKQLLLLKHKV